MRGCRLARMRLRKGLFIALLLAGGVHAEPVGMFTDVKDVGAVSRATEASYESTTGTYTIGASGDNIWAERDAFGFAWKPMSGDAAFAARIEIQGESAQEHRKAGLMFRQSLEPDSAYVDVVVHGNGLTSLQFRTETGGPTREIQCAKQAPTAVRLEKRGDYVLLQLSDIDGKFEPSGCAIKLALRRRLLRGTRRVRARQQGLRNRAVQARVAGTSAEAIGDTHLRHRDHPAGFAGSPGDLSNKGAARRTELHRRRQRRVFPRRRPPRVLQSHGEYRPAPGGHRECR